MDNSTATHEVAVAVRVPWLAIGTLIFVLGCYALNSGFVFPANALAMSALGFSAAYVGALGSAGAVGYILGSILAPFLASAFGLRQTMVAAVLITAAIIVGFALLPAPAWYPMRTMHGMATTTLYVCGESALIALAPAALRGRIIGFYTAFNSIFFASGPSVVAQAGFTGWLPYALVGSLIGLLIIPLLVIGRVAPELPVVPLRKMVHSVTSIPLLLIIIFAWGWIDGSMLNLLSVYGVRRGVDAQQAAFLLTLISVGNVFLQFPIGWIADHVPRRYVLVGLSALGAIFAALLPFSDLAGPIAVAHLVLLGALGFGTFTVSLIALGEVLTGIELVAANAAFGLFWGLGDFIGALSTGWLMDVAGHLAFALALAGGFLVQCLAALILPLRIAAPKHLNPRPERDEGSSGADCEQA
jgi:MFS family permease